MPEQPEAGSTLLDNVPAILAEMRASGSAKNLAGMQHFGINTSHALGLSVPTVRQLARRIPKDHALAQALWESGLHEARLLAAFIDRPAQVTEAQMEAWVVEFDSWDLCDQVCGNLFDRTPFAWQKALEWSTREEEFVRRAGFALMAALAIHDKRATDAAFEPLFEAILAQAGDERNFVKKAVNWALRQIGKRSPGLQLRAIDTAETMLQNPARAAQWIARDALRELRSPAVQEKLRKSSTRHA